MLDTALIKECSDPSLQPAIVEQFLTAVGSADPLAVTVTIGGRLVLFPKPNTPHEAAAIIREHVGHAVVRVGLTQLPAEVTSADVGRSSIAIVDPCENLRNGTAMFAKVARIVTRWYGYPTNREVLQPMLEDSIFAWMTGRFEGLDIFGAVDPGGPTFFRLDEDASETSGVEPEAPVAGSQPQSFEQSAADLGAAGMRIDLTRIGARESSGL